MGMKILLKKSWLVTMSFLLIGLVNQLSAQCIRTSSYGSATVGAAGVVTSISTCSYTSEYSTVSGIVSGNTYLFACTLLGVHKYVTLTDAAAGGTVLAYGTSPLTYTSTIAGTIYASWADDATCASTSSCHVTTVELMLTTPPSCATLSTPTHGATGIAPTVSLTWAATAGATGYYLYVGTDSLPTNYINGTDIGAVTTYQLIGLSNSETYYWRVVPFNTYGPATGCGANKFTTVSCTAPTSLTTSLITPYTASLGWTSGATTVNFDIEIMPSDSTPTGTPTYTGMTNPYSVSGLDEATTYKWYVRASCGGGLYSTWVGPNTFTTACVSYTSFPYTESFDNNVLPTCWTIDPIVSGDSWEVATTEIGGHGATGDATGNGGSFLVIDDSTPETVPAHLYSPNFDLTGLTNPLLTFSYWIGDAANTSELHIDIITSSGTDTSVAVVTDSDGATAWETFSVSLFSYAGQTISIDFRAMESTSFYGDISIDDVVIFDNSTTPVCSSLSMPLDSTIDVLVDPNLSWTASSGVSGYYLSVGTDNPPTNLYNAMDVGNVLNYALTSLSFSSTYYWQVSPYNANGTATGCDIYQFTTMGVPACATLMAPVDSATIVPVDGDLTWTSVYGATGYYLSFGTNNPPTNVLSSMDLGDVQTYAFTGLNYLTDYYWQVTPYNGAGSATGCDVFMFTTADIPSANSCDYTVELYDSYGDGWNGGALSIFVGGTAVLTNVTLSTGYGPGVFTFSVPDGANMTATYSSGSYDSEVTYTIFDSEGNSFFSDGPYPSASVTPGLASCPTCMYSVELYDSYGDGWNGGALSVSVDGTEVLTSVTFTSGYGPEIFYFETYTGAEVTTAYSSGSYDSEVTYSIFDVNGTLMFSDGPYPSSTGTAGFADCSLPPPIFGCTDPIALNYMDTATVDDGSCLYIYGCTDPLALNYMDTATWNDGSCYFMGDSCSLALDYGYINDPMIIDSTLIALDVTWYSFTLGQDYGDVVVSLCGSNFDTKLSVYDACGGTEIAYNDDNFTACSTSASQVGFPVLAAGTYYAKVYGYSNYFGTYNLNITGTALFYGCTDTLAINHDPLANYNDGSCYYMGDSCNLALDYGYINDPMVSSSLMGENDVEWYTVTLSDDYIDVMVSLCGSAFDTKLDVYDACGGTMLGANDDFCSTQSQIDFAFAPAGTYYVKVYGNGLAYGDFDLTISGTMAVYGCIDINALNYDPLANVDNGTCAYPLWNTGISSIISPASGSFLYAPQAVTIEIENLGENAVSNFVVGFSVDGGTPVEETIAATIPSLGSLVYTFTATADVSVGGLHSFTAYTALINDYDTSNDVMTITVDNFVGCYYSLELMDDYGDGWNGGHLNVKINGTDLYASLTLAAGFSGTFDVPVYQGDIIEVQYFQGNFASENSFALLDGFGNQLYIDGATGIPTPLVHTSTASCSAVIYGCTDPTALNYNSAANVNDGSCEYVGESCATALDYGYINDPVEMGSINMDKAMWYTFTLMEDFVDVEVSLCGSNFNTMLEVVDMCNGTQLGMNNDYCGTQSQVDFATLAAGTYYAKIYAGAGIYGDYTLEITGTPYSQTLPQMPWSYLLSGTNHTILIPQTVTVDLGGSPIQPGDYLGVFYVNNGAYQCGGYVEWTGMTTSVAAWGDDNQTPFKDGFVDGENFVWKVWQASTGQLFDAVPTYNTFMPNLGQYAANGMSGLISLGGFIVDYQQIPIPMGWSIISTYIDPVDETCETVFGGIVTFIQIVKDDAGNVYWPSYSVNAIDTIIIGKGYHIKMNTAAVLELSGAAVTPELTPISMAAGWHTFGYLRKTMGPIELMLASINADIVILKNGAGNVYWPQYNINMIGNMMPGQGYQVKLNNATTLTYPANGPVAPSKSVMNGTLHKFTNISNTGENMTIGIPQYVWENTPAFGDEVGIFSSNGTLIGAGVYNGGNMAISVWGDDEYSAQVDGMVSGQMFSVKLWNSASDQVSNLDISWESGSNVYNTNDIAVAGKVTHSFAPLSYALDQNIPNPFTNSTQIGFVIPEDAYLVISVYNLLGEKLQDVVSGTYPAGAHTVDFDATGLASGTYFYKITSDHFVATKSMVVE